MAFLEDPRYRQRWNRIAHDAETVTENAAAGIWSFQHNYINPCFGSIATSLESCTTVCFGDVEDRMRRRRERDEEAELNFDFYENWYEDDLGGHQSNSLLGSWGGEDWDRLLAGKGSQRKHGVAGETSEQPKRKRGMSYGTRGGKRKPNAKDDPTIIPSTQPIGFLSKLPWKMGGTLRYKPSAANLQEHPGKHGDAEGEPLLGSDSSSDFGEVLQAPRKRSGTTGSGDTSDSYRSRGDLFPSDGEGEEDAVALDDEVTYEMIRKDDRSSGKSSRTRSGKGKRPAFGGSRTVSRTTIGSIASRDTDYLPRNFSGSSIPPTSDVEQVPSLEELAEEEERLRSEEDEKVVRQKEAAILLAEQKGLHAEIPLRPQPSADLTPEVAEDEVYEPESPLEMRQPLPQRLKETNSAEERPQSEGSPDDDFVPARLPHFG